MAPATKDNHRKGPSRNTCRWAIYLLLLLFLQSRVSPVAAKRKSSREPEEVPSFNEEEALYQHLLHRYNREIRPVKTATDTVQVNLTFSLKQIHTLDEKSQVFRTYGWLIVEWMDSRLSWSMEKFNNLSEFVIDSSKIWTPELALINAVEGHFPDFSQYRAIISDKGYVRWEPAGSFDTSCKIDITFYPYDKQKCEVIFGTWTYTTYKVNLTNSTPMVILDDYNTSGEWEIYEAEVQRREFVYEADPGICFSKVAGVVRMARLHRFYTMNLILPCAMLSSLTLVTFLSPPDQGEKISLGISILLSFSVFMLTLSENMPKTSEKLPYFGIYTTFVMFMNTVSVMLTVLVLNLHHRNESKPVPNWLRRLAFDIVARLLCIYSKEDTCRWNNGYRRAEVDANAGLHSQPHKKKESKDGYSLAYAAAQFTGKVGNKLKGHNNSMNLGHGHMGHSDMFNGGNSVHQHQPNEERLSYQDSSKTTYTSNAQEDLLNNYNSRYVPHEYLINPEVQEWKKLARIVDRLFFYLTLLSLVSVSVGVFCLLWT